MNVAPVVGPVVRWSPVFNCPDLDAVVVQSNDGEIFRLSRTQVLAGTGCIPFSYDFSKSPGVANLPYASDTLNLLFGCLEPREYPSFDSIRMTFPKLIAFARAAAEYSVFSARAISNELIRRYVSRDPFQVLPFAVDNHYIGLINDVAKTELIDLPLYQVQDAFSKNPHLLFQWIRHRDERHAALQEIRKCASTCHPHSLHCGWPREVAEILLQLDLPSLLASPHTITVKLFNCHRRKAGLADCCQRGITMWEEHSHRIIANLSQFQDK